MSSMEPGGKARPSDGALSPVAFAIAVLSIAGLEPSKKELNENLPSRSAKLRYVIKDDNFYEFKTDVLDKFNYLIELENLGNKL